MGQNAVLDRLAAEEKTRKKAITAGAGLTNSAEDQAIVQSAIQVNFNKPNQDGITADESVATDIMQTKAIKAAANAYRTATPLHPKDVWHLGGYWGPYTSERIDSAKAEVKKFPIAAADQTTIVNIATNFAKCGASVCK